MTFSVVVFELCLAVLGMTINNVCVVDFYRSSFKWFSWRFTTKLKILTGKQTLLCHKKTYSMIINNIATSANCPQMFIRLFQSHQSLKLKVFWKFFQDEEHTFPKNGIYMIIASNDFYMSLVALLCDHLLTDFWSLII